MRVGHLGRDNKGVLTDMGKVHDLGGSSEGEGSRKSVDWVGEQASEDIEFLDPSSLAAFQGPSSLESLLIT